LLPKPARENNRQDRVHRRGPTTRCRNVVELPSEATRDGHAGRRMRRIVLLLTVALLGLSAVAAADLPKYEDLLGHVKAGDAGVDYTALRMAYTRSDAYDPYDSNIESSYGALLKAVGDKDCAAVLAKSDEVLKTNYLSIFSHLFRARCFDEGGDRPGAVRELTVANGLKQSLEASGDGKTVDTAFVVVTMSEEHYLLVGLGFPEERQALLNKNGRAYDQISGHDTKTGEIRTAYFDVSALLIGLQHQLDGGRK
jgi:hypothetical protein